MELFINALARKVLIIGSCIMILCVISCHGTEYTTQHFSFPPGSKPHENDWQYTALVIVKSKKHPITTKSKKKVEIKIYDRSKNIYLKEDFEFDSASIDANVVWENFEELNVELVEIGNEFAKDDYNNPLLNSGPNKLLKLTYEYNKEDKQFQKRN